MHITSMGGGEISCVFLYCYLASFHLPSPCCLAFQPLSHLVPSALLDPFQPAHHRFSLLPFLPGSTLLFSPVTSHPQGSTFQSQTDLYRKGVSWHFQQLMVWTNRGGISKTPPSTSAALPDCAGFFPGDTEAPQGCKIV